MNILIVNFEYPPLGGGGGVATEQIAQELSKRHRVWVLTSGKWGESGPEADGAVQVIRVPVVGRRSLPTASLVSLLSFVPAACIGIIYLCRRQAFDVINAQFVIPSGIPAALGAWLFRVPLVVSFIGGDVYDPTKGISPHRHWWLRMVVRFLAGRATIRTAISNDTKKRAQLLHGVAGEIVVTHLGLQTKATPKASKGELGMVPGRIACVSIGRLIPRKAYDVLLEAWRHVPEADLIIIGDGPLKKTLQDFIIEHGLSGRVRLAGYVSDEKKRQFLKASDVYVSAAEHEGFGIVFLEAMDAHLPIVAVNEGGQTDFLVHGQNALLVEPRSSEHIAAAVKQLVHDPLFRQEMGAKNSRRVQDFYLPKTVEKFEHVLLRATQKPIV